MNARVDLRSPRLTAVPAATDGPKKVPNAIADNEVLLRLAFWLAEVSVEDAARRRMEMADEPLAGQPAS